MILSMNMLKRVLIISITITIILLLVSCGLTAHELNVPSTAPIVPSLASPSDSVTSASPVLPTTTLSIIERPTVQFAITADSQQVARWKEYEQALARKLLSHLPSEEILCEWEILGQTQSEVYVWAVCMGVPPAGRSDKYTPGASIPAVIHLEPDGTIHNVELPRDNYNSYVEGINKIFPEEVKDRIFGRSINISDMVAHIYLRRKNPGLPLIIQSATP